MCVLASAVDIFILTHREAVISNSWSPSRFVFIPLANTTASREILCVLVMREGGVGGVLTRYTAPARWKIWRGINFYYLCSKETQEEKY